MPIMMSNTYDAFIEAGVSKDTAKAAAEEAANLTNRLTKLEIMLSVVIAGVSLLIGGMSYIITLLH